jgi:hypothetical protein
MSYNSRRMPCIRSTPETTKYYLRRSVTPIRPLSDARWIEALWNGMRSTTMALYRTLSAAWLSDYRTSSFAEQTREKLLLDRRHVFYRTDCEGRVRQSIST